MGQQGIQHERYRAALGGPRTQVTRSAERLTEPLTLRHDRAQPRDPGERIIVWGRERELDEEGDQHIFDPARERASDPHLAAGSRWP